MEVVLGVEPHIHLQIERPLDADTERGQSCVLWSSDKWSSDKHISVQHTSPCVSVPKVHRGWCQLSKP